MRPTVQSKRRRREGINFLLLFCRRYITNPLQYALALELDYLSIPSRCQKLARFDRLACAWSISVPINQERLFQQLPKRIWQRAGNAGWYHTPLEVTLSLARCLMHGIKHRLKPISVRKTSRKHIHDYSGTPNVSLVRVLASEHFW